jgi:iron-sulfur cluster protein
MEESPRAVANKSRKQNLLRAIRMSLGLESAAVRHNTQTFNRNRYRAVSELADYDALKDEARRIKEHAIAMLPQLLQVLEDSVHARGGHFYLARTRGDACRYILNVCQQAGARLVVKGKSMTSEEVGLNHVLQGARIEVAETDLAEFILQVADEQPSHIIAPAIHYSRERITALFKRKFDTDEALDTGEDLTRFARKRLREKFLHADVGITGANLIAADTGSLLLVESEGNIRMATLLPPVHVAIAGIEKVIPSLADFGPFVELLAASGTGQRMTSYTSVLTPPLSAPPFALPGHARREREFHLVLVDNGRVGMRDDPVLHEALCCIRCSACLNSCANFQTVGGHAFGGETYSGGIGGSWEAGTSGLASARFAELCTGCSRCVPQCPVRIDIPWLNESLRDRLNRQNEPSLFGRMLGAITATAAPDRSAGAQKIFFGNYHWFARWGARVPGFANWAANLGITRSLVASWLGLDLRRTLPAFTKRTLVKSARMAAVAPAAQAKARAVLFADVYTNYGLPDRGLATLKVLRALGVDVIVSDCMPAGRAPLSQGMIATAKKHAAAAARALRKYLDDGRDVIALEPSVLALFRRDYKHLLSDSVLTELLKDHSFDPVEYLARLLGAQGLHPSQVFDVERSPVGRKLFFHAHCQQKTIGCAAPTERLLRDVGFDVATSEVECCGMAGSFGYKADYYELSMAVGDDLFSQLKAAEVVEPRALIASGTSCAEQLQAGVGRSPLHPIELLATCVR